MSWWCEIYGDFLFTLGAAMLLVAAAAAIIEAFVVARARIEAARQARVEAQSPRALVADGIDPVKLFEALKGFLQALKDLPTWIAMFGAGLALVFLAGQKIEGCTESRSPAVANSPQGNTIQDNISKGG